MNQQVRSGVAAIGVLTIALVSLAVQPVVAQSLPDCSGDFCTCLGQAGQYGIVAAKTVKVISTRTRESDGSGGIILNPHPATVDESVCATVGVFRGLVAEMPGDDDAQVQGDALLLQLAKKVAAVFGGYKIAKVAQPAVSIDGNVITAGGIVKGGMYINFTTAPAPTPDTSGTNVKLPPCQQALTDMQNASLALQALPTPTPGPAPTATIPPKILLKGKSLDITAGTGLTVINLKSIVLRRVVSRSASGSGSGSGSGSSSSTPGQLNIVLPDQTSTVVLNVAGGVSVGRECGITVAPPADPSQVIINAYGKKSAVGVGPSASVDPIILVANGSIGAGRDAKVGNAYGKNVILKGATAMSDLICP